VFAWTKLQSVLDAALDVAEARLVFNAVQAGKKHDLAGFLNPPRKNQSPPPPGVSLLSTGLPEAQGDLDGTDRKHVAVIFCADATSLWKSSATRCDVFVNARKTLWGT
jgi:hypothetical protein